MSTYAGSWDGLARSGAPMDLVEQAAARSRTKPSTSGGGLAVGDCHKPIVSSLVRESSWNPFHFKQCNTNKPAQLSLHS